MKSVLAVLLAFTCVGAQTNIKPGIKTGMAISILEQGKDAYFNSIMKLINNVPLPDIYSPDGKGYMLENSFELTGRLSDVNFWADSANNAVVFTCNKMTAKFVSNHFYYQESVFLKAWGKMVVELNTIDIQVGVGFSTKTLPDGRVVPYITAQDVVVDIDRNDLKIDIDGSFGDWFVELFIPFFKGVIVNMIEDTVSFTLDTGIPYVANTAIDYTDGYFPIPLVPNWIVDWETPSAAVITPEAFSIGTRGLFFDRQYGEQEPPVAIPDMPYYDATLPSQY